MSCLNELDIKNGRVRSKGKIAYVPQSAFLLNTSFRDNITFGMDYDNERYEDAVISCRLVEDLEMFVAGDLTEIGERGINLSGGQKQRVALARAYYSDADIYLIDDALSALDAHVSRQIFNGVFKERLADKTVILVTHNQDLLKEVDQVIVMRDGEIKVTGSFEHVKTHHEYLLYASTIAPSIKENADAVNNSPESSIANKEPFKQSTQTIGEIFKSIRQEELDASPIAYDYDKELQRLGLMREKQQKKPDGTSPTKAEIVVKEKKSQGYSNSSNYKAYFKSFNRSVFFMVMVFYVIFTSLRLFSDFWVSWWAEKRFDGYKN
jgi:ATP-binding cassette subfamily C (CFTR/MRP) protein 1